MSRGTIKILLLCGVLLLIYGVAFAYSFSGWGYAGYGGRRYDNGRYGGYRTPSFFYWGGANYYGDPSVRSGSLTGPGRGGAGPGAGK